MESNLGQIINQFKENCKKFEEIDSFSDKPGIYAFFFSSGISPLEKHTPEDGEIMYIGKTEDSQISRDLNTHFTSNKTGSSTVRRSLGALLRESLSLIPTPRSNTEESNRRFTNYKFEEEGEVKLTKWMKKNLGLSFYEYDKSPKEIETLEKSLIQKLKPILNIKDNLENPYLEVLKNKRKQCVQLAVKNSENTLDVSKKNIVKSSNSKSGKYFDYWKNLLPEIKNAINANKNNVINLDKSSFEQLGDRKKYSFKLHLKEGVVANNIGGSAVARDLFKALNSNLELKKELNKKNIVFRLDSTYNLSININN